MEEAMMAKKRNLETCALAKPDDNMVGLVFDRGSDTSANWRLSLYSLMTC